MTAQLASQLMTYRWLALYTGTPGSLSIHAHPDADASLLDEVRETLGVSPEVETVWLEDEDAKSGPREGDAIVRTIPFGNGTVGHIAVAPFGSGRAVEQLTTLLARDLGGPLRIATLVDDSRKLATTDALTALLNRRAFRTSMENELARAARWRLPLSLLLLDIDHFKAINDGFGHATGDEVLTAIGSTLQKQLRSLDVAARWGGEEFVVTLANTSLADAQPVAERIRVALSEIVIVREGVRVPITASIGVTALRGNEGIDELVERADHAMYRAKSGGRNRVVACEEPASPPEEGSVVVLRAG
jgi:diguanylate cyclase (GGDEF)-like protein